MKTSRKVAIGTVVAIALGGAALAGQRHLKARDADRQAEERARLAQDFAEVGQCLFGDQPRAEEITFRKLMNISSRVDRSQGDWPLSCRARIDRFRTRVETAHYLDKDGAGRLSTALFKVDQYLFEGEVTMVGLAEQLTGVWTLAAAIGIAAGTPETAGPLVPRELAASAARLPVDGLVELEGGPSWQFLAWDRKGFVQCAGDTKLVCRRIDIGGLTPAAARRLRSRGSWSSPSFILLESGDGRTWLLADGKLEALPFRAGSVVGAHVATTGELRVLIRGKAMALWQRSPGEAATRVHLKDALAKVDGGASLDFELATLLGPSLLVARASGEVYRYELEPNGKLRNGTKLDMRLSPSRWSRELLACRAGNQDVILLPGMIAFETPDGFVGFAEQFNRCSASGVVWTAAGGCTPAGCGKRPESVLDREGVPNMRYDDVARDRIGSGDTIAWEARMGGGLMVRGNAADIGTTVVIAGAYDVTPVADTSLLDSLNDGTSTPRLAVFGGPTGGLVLFGRRLGVQLGVAVDARGAVTPLAVEGL